MKIDFVGDSAIQIRFEHNNELNFHKMVRKLHLREIKDMCFAYDTITIFFNPANTNPIGLKDKISNILIANDNDIYVESNKTEQKEGKIIEIPACFCNNCALDTDRVTNHTQLSFEDFVQKYISYTYTVLFIGFQPGFPFLEGLPQQLSIPRLPTPRIKVEAGSVGIGGNQTGIYSFSSPGGWNIIGKTDFKLFDFNSGAILKAGDKIKFKIQKHIE